MRKKRPVGLTRGRWFTVATFQRRLTWLGRINSEDYFTHPGLQPVRDAWIAGTFAHHLGAPSVCLPADRWPDFQVTLPSGTILDFEAVEAMAPGRKRGQEYREWRSQGYRPRVTSQDQTPSALRALVPLALQGAVQNKVQKGYPRGAAALLIYLNIGVYFWDADIEDQLAECTRDAFGPFKSVWVMRGGSVNRFWPLPRQQYMNGKQI